MRISILLCKQELLIPASAGVGSEVWEFIPSVTNFYMLTRFDTEK